MNAEHVSRHREALLSHAPLVQRLLSDPTNIREQELYTQHYGQIARAAKKETAAHFHADYVEATYAECAYQNLFPFDRDAFQQDVVVMMPIMAGWELREQSAIELFAPEVMDVVFSLGEIIIYEGREEEARLWIQGQMEYGASLREKSESLKIFRDFVNFSRD